MTPPKRAIGSWFAALAAAFAFTALFHLAAILLPSLAPGSSASRHAAFVAINTGVVAGLLRRPPWFVWSFAVLTAQQLYSHGLDVWRAWSGAGRIDWMSLAVLAIMLLTMGTLVRCTGDSDRSVVDRA
jgi:hypothetical protein